MINQNKKFPLIPTGHLHAEEKPVHREREHRTDVRTHIPVAQYIHQPPGLCAATNREARRCQAGPPAKSRRYILILLGSITFKRILIFINWEWRVALVPCSTRLALGCGQLLLHGVVRQILCLKSRRPCIGKQQILSPPYPPALNVILNSHQYSLHPLFSDQYSGSRRSVHANYEAEWRTRGDEQKLNTAASIPRLAATFDTEADLQRKKRTGCCTGMQQRK